MLNKIDVEKTIMDFSLTNDQSQKKEIAKKIRDAAEQAGIYPQASKSSIWLAAKVNLAVLQSRQSILEE